MDGPDIRALQKLNPHEDHRQQRLAENVKIAEFWARQGIFTEALHRGKLPDSQRLAE
jgi:hypothetical protein